ncbi:MAG: RNA pseudouridine synthase [Deltaproteobacteria bacterium]|jgi:23S rRNA pseudouridine1911/1915/1917 synthase|nr:RNA pseudouridine synthase [Deltaproteobacteria bacterium]
MNGDYFFHPSWPIFYHDNHLLVLYKPAGLLAQADATEETSLLELGKLWLKNLYNKPGRVFLGLVHRLDRPVAGVMLFCRTSKAAARISEQFRAGKAEKYYLAVLEGELKKKYGSLVNLIDRGENRSSHVVPEKTPGAREARLSFTVLDCAKGRTLVRIKLETGRRHQIRVQFAHIGHPLAGDLRYGAPAPLPQKQIALFAKELIVNHPVRGERLRFESPLPAGWPWQAQGDETGGLPWDWRELEGQLGIEGTGLSS